MRHAMLAALFLGFTSAAAAQTGAVVNPSAIEFESPDHAKMLADGVTPVVLRYDVCWRFVGAATCFQTTDLGKPAPVGTQNGNPLIRVDIRDIVRPLPTTNVFEATATATGPGGTSPPSIPSNSFLLGTAPSTLLRATVR